MSLFGKLKDRLFKSSAKIDEGLTALVEDGASTAPEPTPDPAPAPVPEKAPEPAPTPAPAPQPKPQAPVKPEAKPEVKPEPEAPKSGLLGRLFRSEASAAPRRLVDDAMLEDLEDLLIQADLGVDTAARVAANLAEDHFGKRLSAREIKESLAREVARIMEPVAKPMPLYASKPQVVLVVGVNGSGKTTTIGKLASQFRAAGKSVVIAAG
ncbi:MAG: signal recognition particle-docking protein FtsY, partial [Rhodobacteraceae bacterium]|nr:signal recognition particle-docking protein FtsY [Paracoccaceae bacterium]